MRRRPLKALLGNPRVRAVLCAVAAAYIRLVYATSRWQVEGGEIPARFWDSGRPFILAFWHGRILMMPRCWRRGVPMAMLISQHRDGQLIADTIRHFDLGTVRGSSTRGGTEAVRAMVKTLKRGGYAGFTPDGPRGPRMRAQLGVVSVARLSGAPIIPCAHATSRRRVLSGWDRFLVALPFSRGAFVWGEPIAVPRDADGAAMEAARQKVEAALNAVTDRADRLVGGATIAPAPAETSPTVPVRSAH